MSKIFPAYLKWRDGRPRWEPGPKLRGQGFHGRDLKDDAGRWLGMEAAIRAADALNVEVKVNAALPPKRRPPPPAARTVRQLIDDWQASPKFQRLKPNTQADYRYKLAAFAQSDFLDRSVAAVSKPQLYGYWEEVYRDRGHHMANGILATVGAMFAYAELRGWRPEGSNPAARMRRPKPPPRLSMWLPEEIDAALAAADELSEPEIGDAIVIALHSGQRMSDVLAMPPRIFEAGRIAITQFKRGALVDIPVTAACTSRVDQIRARWRERNRIGCATIIVRGDGRQVSVNTMSKRFERVRELAARSVPSIAARTLQDLRDTAVTRLALAGCTLPQIAAITGHNFATITQVLGHYLALQSAMADEAIAKLEAWLQREGIAV
jgi:integrase